MAKKTKLIIILTCALILLILLGFGTVKAGQFSKAKKQVDLGNKYLTDGKYKEAILAFEKAISVDKNNVEARIGAAKAYVEINELQKAEDILKKGIELTPKKDGLYLELSSVYLKKGKIKEAINILDLGYEKTKSDRIKKKLKEIEQKLSVVIEKNPLQISKRTVVKLVMGDVNVSAKWELKGKNIGDLIKEDNETVKFISVEIGTQKIAAKVGSIEKTASIEVKEQIAGSIEIASLPSKAVVGDSMEIKAIVKDESGNQIDAEPTWQLSGDGAKLTATKGKTNKIEFVKEGKVQVTVEYEGFKSTVEVTIEKKTIVSTTPVYTSGREAEFDMLSEMKPFMPMDIPAEMWDSINKNKAKINFIYCGVEHNKNSPLDYNEVFSSEAQFNSLADTIKTIFALKFQIEDRISSGIISMSHAYEENGKIYLCQDCRNISLKVMDKSQHGRMRNDIGYFISVKAINMVNNESKGYQYSSFFIKKDLSIKYTSAISPGFGY